MKVKTIIFGLLIIFSLSSCGQTSNFNSNSNNCNSTSNEIDGGEHSRVVGYYEFNSFDDYLSFYNVFKKYNDERYLVPLSSNDYDIIYSFKSEGMYLDDLNAKRYDLNFQYQTMAVTINDNNFNLKMYLNDISGRNLFQNEFSFSYKKESITSSSNFNIQLICEDFVIGNGIFSSKIIDEQIIKENLDNVLTLIKGGYDYAL